MGEFREEIYLRTFAPAFLPLHFSRCCKICSFTTVPVALQYFVSKVIYNNVKSERDYGVYMDTQFAN